ncbi:MAG: bifunctional serine/threonine-protein kinase/formylglycine-generating enzyme family protein [Polyangiaceae bacterium]
MNEDDDTRAIADEATVSVRPGADSSPALVGRVIASKYVVKEIIGRGGMGVVVRAHHLALDQPVALKFLLGATPTASVRFQREAKIVFQLTSEHIVRLFDIGTFDDGAPFLVMELVSGETLSERLARSGPLPPREAIDAVLQACVGVAEAHRVGVVHRDLKPSNLMVTTRTDGTALVKVLDFGIAKILAPKVSAAWPAPSEPVEAVEALSVADTVEASPPPRAPDSRRAAETTAIVGSPLYMSPEQLERPMAVDARTDVWSLGVVLHELVTGKPPFDGDSLDDVRAAITGGAPHLAFDDDDRGRALDRVVRRCLARDPAQRFEDVGELASALASIGDEPSLYGLAERASRVLAHSAPSSSSSAPASGEAREPSAAPSVEPGSGRVRALVGGSVALAAIAAMAWAASRPLEEGAQPVTSMTEAPSESAGAAVAGSPSASAVRPTALETCPAGMIFVPAGAFTMGTAKGHGHDKESPQRIVRLSAYCIDRTEVTVEAYVRCADTGACPRATTTEEWRATASDKQKPFDQCNSGIAERAKHPINCVDWNAAFRYCRWVAKGDGDLPTEAQWERAARGTDGRTYPWGEQKPTTALVNGNDDDFRAWRASAGLTPVSTFYPGSDGYAGTAPVGSFPAGASPIGALDMAGNVWEWTADFYAPYDASALEDPLRALDQGAKELHPVRGGGWPDNMNRTSERSAYSPTFKFPDLGFRCAAKPGATARD